MPIIIKYLASSYSLIVKKMDWYSISRVYFASEPYKSIVKKNVSFEGRKYILSIVGMKEWHCRGR